LTNMKKVREYTDERLTNLEKDIAAGNSSDIDGQMKKIRMNICIMKTVSFTELLRRRRYYTTIELPHSTKGKAIFVRKKIRT